MSSSSSQQQQGYGPDWVSDTIWYQLFPERFRNGCPASNPQLEDLRIETPDSWRLSAWAKDWYQQDEWEKEVGTFSRSVYFRRFGGDLVGVRDKLDYLQELGINGIYLNPIFWSESLHKYDSSSLHHVDPSFGPDRAGDLALLAAAQETDDPTTWVWTAADLYFLDLIAEIHRRNMRVIIDGVFNHTGVRFFAFQDTVHKGKASAYWEWYTISRWYKDGSFAYKGWNGFRSLPNFGIVKTVLCSRSKTISLPLQRVGRRHVSMGKIERALMAGALMQRIVCPMVFGNGGAIT